MYKINPICNVKHQHVIVEDNTKKCQCQAHNELQVKVTPSFMRKALRDADWDILSLNFYVTANIIFYTITIRLSIR